MKLSIFVTISGMTLDVLGAVVLARSFVMKRPEDVFREISSYGTWDFPITRGARDLVLSWLVQRVEARTGAFILFVGFSLQAVSQFLGQYVIGYGFWLLGLIIFSVFLAFFFLQNWFVRSAVGNAYAFYTELEKIGTGDNWKKFIEERREELSKISNAPMVWLKGGFENDPPDNTLTSNE